MGRVWGGFWEGFGRVWELSFAGFCIAEASEALWCWLCLALLGFVADVFFFLLFVVFLLLFIIFAGLGMAKGSVENYG